MNNQRDGNKEQRLRNREVKKENQIIQPPEMAYFAGEGCGGQGTQ